MIEHFITFKLKFSVTYDVVFTVNVPYKEMTKSVWLTLNCLVLLS